ncbi:hypothetical protein EHP00_1327 [Ecytonucleospora hepatopenaei]|uniref:PSP1 C-terminal domain-containing protein n=1 Tax=Ecytonucleospora hepatopenaei TaxID=646526 RepID=A0A1W0E5C8_9MICR|nr:hypothetical protein EHP00_1327 [Ecytonucleospora hepatopenaei]
MKNIKKNEILLNKDICYCGSKNIWDDTNEIWEEREYSSNSLINNSEAIVFHDISCTNFNELKENIQNKNIESKAIKNKFNDNLFDNNIDNKLNNKTQDNELIENKNIEYMDRSMLQNNLNNIKNTKETDYTLNKHELNQDLFLNINTLRNENEYVKNVLDNKIVRKEEIYRYLVAFESGRTLIVFSKKEELSINTYVVVDADRGEDIGKTICELPENLFEETPGFESDRNHFYKEGSLLCNNVLNNFKIDHEHAKFSNAEVFDIKSHITNIDNNMLSILYSKIDSYKNTSTKNYFLTNFLFSEQKKFLRYATEEEIATLLHDRKESERNSLVYLNHIKDVYCIDMEITKCEYQYDCKRITFYYKSTKRIDFRELVKELFKHFKIRIWMCSENREFYR